MLLPKILHYSQPLLAVRAELCVKLCQESGAVLAELCVESVAVPAELCVESVAVPAELCVESVAVPAELCVKLFLGRQAFIVPYFIKSIRIRCI